ncbi:MAG: hypothetical protein Satyrvirus40_7 [Satyrvirus sp.]|uniref:Uncharacterized protein n=1 Tax=Satyrvirus sp. TaxID=2487771 RepID=A0A3G5AGR1_9VIRU|nr:MAG: hypothetical protein Satyrvirus40_7 [Satyrvirus sp.]
MITTSGTLMIKNSFIDEACIQLQKYGSTSKIKKMVLIVEFFLRYQ